MARGKPGPTTPTISVPMEFNYATKRQYRYDATDPDAVVGCLYIHQSAFEGDPPNEITVTVDAT